MNKQNVLHAYNETGISLKKEGNSDTYYSMDETWRRYTKGNKSDTRGQIVRDFK